MDPLVEIPSMSSSTTVLVQSYKEFLAVDIAMDDGGGSSNLDVNGVLKLRAECDKFLRANGIDYQG